MDTVLCLVTLVIFKFNNNTNPICRELLSPELSDASKRYLANKGLTAAPQVHNKLLAAAPQIPNSCGEARLVFCFSLAKQASVDADRAEEARKQAVEDSCS